ncbi:hypothetical protein DYB28_009905, partial [Aphanomyces astaci]
SSCGGSAADATSAGASAPGDVDMGEVEPVKLLNAPALLLPLSFKGSTKAERRAFMREYQRYTSQIQALQSTSQQPFLMPVGACMEHFYKHHADSRVSRMLDNLMRVLEADGEEWVLHQEGKLVLEIITKAMKPAPLQVAVSKQQQLQRNMVLKMDVLHGGTLTSGNETLVLEGLLLALERLGAKLNVETKPALALKPYGATSRPLQVTRQVQFKILTLETSIGPLVLRGLRAWVEVKKFEVDCSSDQVDPEDNIYAEDVACSTPAMEKRAELNAEFRRILDEKIAEGVQHGLSAAQVDELRGILSHPSRGCYPSGIRKRFARRRRAA